METVLYSVKRVVEMGTHSETKVAVKGQIPNLRVFLSISIIHTSNWNHKA